jgi:cytochrome c-type biogenesis protein CcmH
MVLWLILVAMTAAAIFAVLWPLSRRTPAMLPAGDLAVYRDQLDEIERDRGSGLIGAADADAARVEVSRRLLAAADAADQSFTASVQRRRIAALAALVLLPLGAGAIYVTLGTPDLPGAPLAARRDLPIEQRSIESMVAQVEAHLDRNPQDGRGWEVLAPVYMRQGRFDDAAKARGNALRLLGETAVRQADLGEALTAAANGMVTAQARKAFERARALDESEPRVQFFLGLAAEQDGKKDEAARIWRALLANAKVDAPWREFVQRSLARVDPAAAAAGPSSEDMAAAEQLSPQARGEMIRGMVERLAARLHEDGSDVDGWLRLIRAYMVLGERDKARAAAADARRALAGDGDKAQRFERGAKELGIEG